MAEAGLDPKTRLHDCRHGVATVMFEQGVHPALASAVLGHSSVAFTMDTYQHVGDQMTGQAAAALDDVFAADVAVPNSPDLARLEPAVSNLLALSRFHAITHRTLTLKSLRSQGS